MASPRAVRIPRPSRPAADAPLAPAEAGPTSAFRPNRAGTQRAVRLSLLFLVVLAALYAGFAIVQRGVPGASSPGGQFDLYFFTAVTAVVAVAGTFVALGQAPRGVEVSPTETVVVGRFGQRRSFPPLGVLQVREVRSYRTALLSSAPVAVYELTPKKGVSRTVLVEQGLFDAAA
jgi:hypothetical protein